MTIVSGAGPSDVLFRIAGGNVKLGKNGAFVGTFLAPSAHIDVHEGAMVTGALHGAQVQLKKDTSLAAVIAVDDLLRQAKIGSEATRAPLTFYLAAGALYLLLTGLSDAMREHLERRARRGLAGAAR